MKTDHIRIIGNHIFFKTKLTKRQKSFVLDQMRKKGNVCITEIKENETNPT